MPGDRVSCKSEDRRCWGNGNIVDFSWALSDAGSEDDAIVKT